MWQDIGTTLCLCRKFYVGGHPSNRMKLLHHGPIAFEIAFGGEGWVNNTTCPQKCNGGGEYTILSRKRPWKNLRVCAVKIQGILSVIDN